MNSIKKYVVSNSLQAAGWQNSEIISGDVAQKLAAIKAQDCGDITMSGSAITARWLLREGLLDELNLLLHPMSWSAMPGSALPADEPSIPLELVSAQTFKSGVLNLGYAAARD
jgi:dihydrofolate reductase